MAERLYILHFEDDPLDTELAAKTLRAEGFAVKMERVQDLSRFARALARPEIALVLSDYTVPGVDAVEALKIARQKRPEIPFVFLSGAIGEERATEALKLGATDYVLKQHLERLPRAVRRALQESAEQARRKAAEEELRKAKEALAAANTDLERAVQERTAELKNANQELEALIYTISHDLRAPIRHIMGFANALETDAAPHLDGEHRQYLQVILGAGRRMEALLEALLKFSRLSRADMILLPVSLGAVVEEARRELAPLAKNRRIDWRIGELPEVNADPALLQSVITNLIANAIKYTAGKDPALIEIQAETKTEEIVFSVRDNGAGFDIARAGRLFGVFQRLHSHDQFEGTGIGLASVRRIIHRHGGRVWATAKEGAGATFYFALPRRITLRP